MRFALLDLTGGASTRDGGKLTRSLLEQLAEACTIQLNRDVAPQWGGDYSVRVADTAEDLRAAEIPFAFVPSFVDGAKAIAYHTTNGNGQPMLFDAITECDALNAFGNSVTVAASHELVETAGDPWCNYWADDGAGTEYAIEIADPVENRAYEINGLYVSDFVLRAYFAPNCPGPYSFCGYLGQYDGDGPFAMPPQLGYQITRAAGGPAITRGIAARRPWRPGSRRAKRGIVAP